MLSMILVRSTVGPVEVGVGLGFLDLLQEVIRVAASSSIGNVCFI